MRTLLVAAVFAGAAALAACGSDSATGPSGNPGAGSPAGSYAISTVNAKPLPFAMFSDTNYLYEVTGGTFSLTADGRYSRSMTFRQTIPGDVSIFVDTSSGTWVLSGPTVTFTDAADASVDNASWSTGTLTFNETNGVATNVYVYALVK